jgi:hypothetical protein
LGTDAILVERNAEPINATGPFVVKIPSPTLKRGYVRRS